MNKINQIGIKTIRKDAWDKVTGRVKYNSDTISSDMLHGRMFISTYAHALIKDIDISKAQVSNGVRAVITGEDSSVLTGSTIQDRPILARDKVRYFGEPIALVVADSEQEAMVAVDLIEVEYEPLAVVNSIRDGIRENPTLVHKNLGHYFCPDEEILPLANSNIAHQV